MKQWLDFIPLLLFFIAFKVLGIFPATMVLIAATVIVYGGLWIATRELERNQLITLVVTLLFGGITLALHDVTYLKWKAPIINWVFAIVFLGSHFIGEKVVIERMLGHAITAPTEVWKKLNLAWVLFFIFAGAINLYVAFHWEAHWVDFKVFGSLGMTLVFVVAQTLYLSRYIKHPESPSA
ncbi:MAG: septation protein A [Pedobacter sp.]|nr:septation protein A [Pedobacter sp.]